MPDNNKKHKTLPKDQFLKLVKAGIRKVESNNRYGALNTTKQKDGTPTYALGAYQFVPSHHWNDIVDFMNKDPKYKGQFQKISKSSVSNFKNSNAINQYNKFLKLPKTVQDNFMNEYASKRYDLAKTLHSKYGNLYNLRMDEVYSMIHHQGEEAASEALRKGKINYTSLDGTGGDKYMKKYNTGVYEGLGIAKDKKGNYVGTKTQRNEFIYDKMAGGNKKFSLQSQKDLASGKMTNEQYNKFFKLPKTVQDNFMNKYTSPDGTGGDKYMKKYNTGVNKKFSLQSQKDLASGKMTNEQYNKFFKLPKTVQDNFMNKYNTGVNKGLGIAKDKKGNYVGTKTQRNEFIYDKMAGGNKYKNPNSVVINQKASSADYQEYKKFSLQSQKDLASGKITNEQYNEQLKGLVSKYKKNGSINDINSFISNENRLLKQSKFNKAEANIALFTIFNKADFQTNLKDDKREIRNSIFIPESNLTVEEKKFIKDNPKLFKDAMSRNYANGAKGYSLADPYAYSNRINDLYKEFHGKGFKPIYKKDGKIYLNNNLKVNDDSKYKLGGGRDFLDNAFRPGVDNHGGLTTFLSGLSYDSSKINSGVGFIREDDLGELTEDTTDDQIQEAYDTYDSNPDPSQNVNTSSSSNNNTSPEASTETQKDDTKTAEAILAQVDYQREQDELARQQEENELNQGALDVVRNVDTSQSGFDNGYSKEQYKQNDIPVTDIANSLGGIIVGDAMSKTRLPERDEQVSQAYQSYVSEMAEIAKRGLSVEDEAAAKQKISESYSIGVKSLEKSSGGNRNIVLGNLGQLDAQRSNSLLALSVEDSKMKMEGLQAYGEGVKYISEFDANRDIANNEREYEVAQEKRRNGGDLTSAAWKNLGDSLATYDNNKPGSLNHMLKTSYLRNTYGYDPNLKDNGKGDIKYTWSWLQAQNENKARQNGTYKALQDRLNTLNENEMQVIGKYLRQTGSSDIDGAIKYSDYILSNRDKDGFDLGSINDPLDYYNNAVNKKPSEENGLADPINLNTINQPSEKNQTDFFNENPSVWENIYDKNSYHSDIKGTMPNFDEKGIDFSNISNIAQQFLNKNKNLA